VARKGPTAEAGSAACDAPGLENSTTGGSGSAAPRPQKNRSFQVFFVSASKRRQFGSSACGVNFLRGREAVCAPHPAERSYHRRAPQRTSTPSARRCGDFAAASISAETEAIKKRRPRLLQRASVTPAGLYMRLCRLPRQSISLTPLIASG